MTDNPAPNNVFIALEALVSEKATLDAKVGREGSRVRFLTEDDTTIIDITSKFGIDKATIRRKSDEWPKAILVRLHLSGLESFKASSGDVAVEWSVSSTGKNAKRVSLRRGRDELALDDKSPYHTTVRIADGNGKDSTQRRLFRGSTACQVVREESRGDHVAVDRLLPQLIRHRSLNGISTEVSVSNTAYRPSQSAPTTTK